MSQSVPLGDLGGTPSAKFTNIGDSVVGRITKIEQRDQTNLDGEVVTFADGRPRPQWVFTLDTANGELALYAKGGTYEVVEGEGQSMISAIQDAAKAAGAKTLDAGAELAVAFTGRGKVTKAGRDQPKLYRAQYKPANTSVPADLFTT